LENEIKVLICFLSFIQHTLLETFWYNSTWRKKTFKSFKKKLVFIQGMLNIEIERNTYHIIKLFYFILKCYLFMLYNRLFAKCFSHSILFGFDDLNGLLKLSIKFTRHKCVWFKIKANITLAARTTANLH
jgi:hypothetical protein